MSALISLALIIVSYLFLELISAEEGRLLGTKEYTHIFTCRSEKIH